LQTRAFSHVDDVCPLIAMSPFVDRSANETFNIGADTPHTVMDLAGAVADAFDVECNIEHLPARNEVVHAFSDHAKLQSVFSPAAPISLKDGIFRMAAWVQARGPMQPVEFPGDIEVPRNLPPGWAARVHGTRHPRE
jgi:UDP-glucose 4-epimerase